MCGIAGILLAQGNADPRRLAAAGAMAAALVHRGPDGGGVWQDKEAGIALAHRRLAIVDLSDAGKQPMVSHNQNLIVTYNGEIYNSAEIKTELEARGYHFRGGSDTEVMLAAFECFGIEEALTKFAGMFALALWDRRKRTLHLVRDRLGKKPLFVGFINRALVFASELKAFQAVPGFDPAVSTKALEGLLSQGWIAESECIWEGVFKVPPAHVLSICAEDLVELDQRQVAAKAKPYWSLRDTAEWGQRNLLELTDAECESELDRMLRLVIGQRMTADVPLGAFLSGGIDSTAVVALMQAQSQSPIRTFTMGFGEAGYDEASHASAVARHLGTKHTAFRVTANEARAVIPELPQIWDEPFADESQIPTLLVSRLARQSVTVALTGDGGDECLGGYSRHVMSKQFEPFMRLPLALRKSSKGLLSAVGSSTWNRIFQTAPMSSKWRSMLTGTNIERLADVIDATDENDLYDRLIRFKGMPPGTNAPSAARAAAPDVPEGLPDIASRFIYRDMSGYMQGDILVKLDRASMAVSLEGRCPLIDHRLIEFCWRLPTSVKIRDGQGKWLLRQVLSRYVPEALFSRPKQGFNVPIGAWLRGPLREWAGDLLDAHRIGHDGFLDRHHVQACWQGHVSGRADHSRQLWAILMFQAWLENNRSQVAPLAIPNTKMRLTDAAVMQTGI